MLKKGEIMNKKSRILIPLISALPLVLSGCMLPVDPFAPTSGEEPSSSTSEPTSAPTSDPSSSTSEAKLLDPTSIKLSRRDLGLLITYKYDEEGDITEEIESAESFELSYSSLPHQLLQPNINFRSTNTSVATVTKGTYGNVMVQATGEGECKIIASSDDGSVQASCNVFVAGAATKRNMNSQVKKIVAGQDEAGLTALDTILIDRTLTNKRIKNGKVFESTISDETYVVSKENAFFLIDSYDTYVKTEGGSESYEKSAWIIYTDEYYDTYLFHQNGDNKTYMVADSTSFISQGKTRYQAACAVLDSLFKSGSGFLTRNFDDVLGKSNGDPITSGAVSSSTRRGILGEDGLIISYGDTYHQTADRDDEDDYYIPAGTAYDISISHDSVAKEYHMQNDYLEQKMMYELMENGEVNSYENNYYIEYQYKTKDIVLNYPDTAEYGKVDSIFDL